MFNSVHPLPAYLRETGSRGGFDHRHERGRDERGRVSEFHFNLNYLFAYNFNSPLRQTARRPRGEEALSYRGGTHGDNILHTIN